MTHGPDRRGEIRAHTGLRGVAALTVVAYHPQLCIPHLAIEDATPISAFTYRFVEVPARAWRSRRLLHRRAGPIDSAPPAP